MASGAIPQTEMKTIIKSYFDFYYRNTDYIYLALNFHEGAVLFSDILEIGSLKFERTLQNCIQTT